MDERAPSECEGYASDLSVSSSLDFDMRAEFCTEAEMEEFTRESGASAPLPPMSPDEAAVAASAIASVTPFGGDMDTLTAATALVAAAVAMTTESLLAEAEAAETPAAPAGPTVETASALAADGTPAAPAGLTASALAAAGPPPAAAPAAGGATSDALQTTMLAEAASLAGSGIGAAPAPAGPAAAQPAEPLPDDAALLVPLLSAQHHAPVAEEPDAETAPLAPAVGLAEALVPPFFTEPMFNAAFAYASLGGVASPTLPHFTPPFLGLHPSQPVLGIGGLPDPSTDGEASPGSEDFTPPLPPWGQHHASGYQSGESDEMADESMDGTDGLPLFLTDAAPEAEGGEEEGAAYDVGGAGASAASQLGAGGWSAATSVFGSEHGGAASVSVGGDSEEGSEEEESETEEESEEEMPGLVGVDSEDDEADDATLPPLLDEADVSFHLGPNHPSVTPNNGAGPSAAPAPLHVLGVVSPYDFLPFHGGSAAGPTPTPRPFFRATPRSADASVPIAPHRARPPNADAEALRRRGNVISNIYISIFIYLSIYIYIYIHIYIYIYI